MRVDLLLALARHLEFGNLAHKQFDFSCINSGPKDIRGCGTTGCAVGELPELWPGDWAWEVDGVFLRAASSAQVDAYHVSVAKFFEIPPSDTYELFFLGSSIGRISTAKEMAAHIREYIVRTVRR